MDPQGKTRFSSDIKFLQYHQQHIKELHNIISSCVSRRDKEFLVNFNIEDLTRFILENSSGKKLTFVRESNIDEDGYHGL